MPMKFFSLVALFIAICTTLAAQGYSYYEDSQFDPFQRQTYKVGRKTLHSSLRSYKLTELQEYFDLDSVIYDGIQKPQKKMNIFRNFLYDDFLSWHNDEIYAAINPMCDFSVGKDDDLTTYINSRGFYVNGHLGKNFWFYMDFTENQAAYPDYVTEKASGVIPGLARYKTRNGDPDYQTATGYIGFSIGKYLDFQIGKGKTFIGDGYRSLLLSDAATAYPMFKMNVTVMNVKYMFMMAQLTTDDAQGVSNNGYRHKYSFSHYLDWNVSNRFSFGLFENVTMTSWRKTGESRSIDWEYVNPFIIFRPGEFDSGSPDKMLMGINTKFIAANWLTFYGQFMINEFQIDDLLDHDGFFQNKYGFQLGFRTFDLFGIKGLDWQTEYTRVRPFCYSQWDGMGCYTHHSESLAHPLGANFRETLTIVNYRNKRIALRGEFLRADYGDDVVTATDTIFYGHNPNIPLTYRNANNVWTLQGDKTKLIYGSASFSFIINPRNMMTLTLGTRIRKLTSELKETEESKHFYFSLRWNLKQQYFDF